MIGHQIDCSFAVITTFGLSSPVGLRSCVPCVLRLLLVHVFGRALHLSLAACHAYRIYSLRVSLAGHCAHQWLLAVRIASTSRACLWLGIARVIGCLPHVSLPSLLPRYPCPLGCYCLSLTPLLLTLHRHHCQCCCSCQGPPR